MKNKRQKKKDRAGIIIVLLFLILGSVIVIANEKGLFLSEVSNFERQETRKISKSSSKEPETKKEKGEREKAIEEIKKRPEFRERVEKEATRIYLREKRNELESDYETEIQEVESQLEEIRAEDGSSL